MNQASFKTVYDNFFSRLEKVFGQPETPDPEGFFDEYYNALKRFTEAQLTTGVEKIIASRVHRSWPTAGVCVQFCSGNDPESKSKAKQPDSLQNTRDWMSQVDTKVKFFVHGGYGFGAWSPGFSKLPLVERALKNGWSSELGAAVRHAVKRDIMGDLRLGSPESYLPTDEQFIEYSEAQAKRARLAAEWRRNNSDHRTIRPTRDSSFKRMKPPSAPRGSTIQTETAE